MLYLSSSTNRKTHGTVVSGFIVLIESTVTKASFDLLRTLPTTSKSNPHIMLVVDLFSSHAEGYAITVEEKQREVAMNDW